MVLGMPTSSHCCRDCRESCTHAAMSARGGASATAALGACLGCRTSRGCLPGCLYTGTLDGRRDSQPLLPAVCMHAPRPQVGGSPVVRLQCDFTCHEVQFEDSRNVFARGHFILKATCCVRGSPVHAKATRLCAP